LLSLALSERWPMNPEAKAVAIRRLEAVVMDPATKPRAFHVALRALATLSGLNLKVVETSIRAQHADELAGRIEELERLQQEGHRW
jgi:hypothetical protein